MRTAPTLVTAHDHERHFQDSVALLRSVRATLAALLDRAEGGEDGLFADIAKKQAELETALKRAFEAEDRWNDWQARHGGPARADGPLDLAALRDQIACRLNRLADCCDAEG
jgi:hypothetical protein